VDKRIIFVVGDSFIAGYGIENCKDRMSDLLQHKLSEKYVVINIAKNGWGTMDEYNAILSHPFKPNIIILSHCINDLEGTCNRLGFKFTFPKLWENTFIRYFVKRSYLLNFIYWKVYELLYADLGERYWEYLQLCYSNTEAWDIHKEEILGIINYSKKVDADLIVIVFPELRRIQMSKEFTSKTVDFFNSQEVKVIDLANILLGRALDELIVHRGDGHPSVKLNEEISDRLFYMISAKEKR
jgi:hypothetical protein